MAQIADTPAVDLERKPPTEDADTAEIVRNMRAIQAQKARAQHRPLGRGTHTKGAAVHATLEIFDLARLMPDRALAARLAQGIYAHPGTYPAVIRFANGASQRNPDRARDARAMTMSVDVTAAGIPGVTRLDYSMNSVATFPLKDAHAFATFTRVTASANKLRAFFSLPVRDQLGVLRSLLIGAGELKRARAYQTVRYWSTVPYRHGGPDAIKYSAVPSPANPSSPLHKGPNCLQDELARHVNNDVQPAAWDFALQLLDTERMTRWGRRHDAPYWVENSSIAWNERQAPFHVVGRITLTPKSMLTPEACEVLSFDVTTYRTPDATPIGGLNRARWAAEVASRDARLAAMTTREQPPQTITTVPPRRVNRWFTRAAALLVLGVVAYYGPFAYYAWDSARGIPAAAAEDEIVYLDAQGWGPSRESTDRQTYYYTGQGASLMGLPYSWFVHLERPFRTARLADPAFLRSLNFIVDHAPTAANPDMLPVGFARTYDAASGQYLLDVTCAACHTGELHVKDPATRKVLGIRIDGGQAMHAFTDLDNGKFVTELGYGAAETMVNPAKFNRFAKAVLGSASSWSQRASLWRQLASFNRAVLAASHAAFDKSHYPVQEGYGRTDALARIANTVFGERLGEPRNYHPGTGPVSYPYLWNIWKFDWVQYNASVSQPLARNVGEAMGTGASYQLVDSFGRPIPESERYRTSIQFDNLERIEGTLQKLRPPVWPENVLGRIDPQRAHAGQLLFEHYCEGCHGPHLASPSYTQAISPLRRPTDELWLIKWKALNDVGTDPTTARNFIDNTLDLTRLGMPIASVRALLEAPLQQQQARWLAAIAQLDTQLAAEARKPGGGDPALVADLTTQRDYANSELSERFSDSAITTFLDGLDLQKMNGGVGLNILGLTIRNRYYADRHIDPDLQQCLEGFGTLDIPQLALGYKPRPLAGIWATPPYLHNGSVPNLFELLSPPTEKDAKGVAHPGRSERFFLGRRDFDPVKVGYATEPAEGTTSGFWYDTKQAGNSNAGHYFWGDQEIDFDQNPVPAQGHLNRGFSVEERYQIIEYLKTRRDDPADTPPVQPPACYPQAGAGQ
jgi:mono/diheme cytochrome c family protein